MVNSNIGFEKMHVFSIVKLLSSKTEKFPFIFRAPLSLLSPSREVFLVLVFLMLASSLYLVLKHIIDILAHIEPDLLEIAGGCRRHIKSSRVCLLCPCTILPFLF